MNIKTNQNIFTEDEIDSVNNVKTIEPEHYLFSFDNPKLRKNKHKIDNKLLVDAKVNIIEEKNKTTFICKCSMETLLDVFTLHNREKNSKLTITQMKLCNCKCHRNHDILHVRACCNSGITYMNENSFVLGLK